MEAEDDLQAELALLIRRWEPASTLQSEGVLKEAARVALRALLGAAASMKFCFGTADQRLRVQLTALLSELAWLLESDLVTQATGKAYDTWLTELDLAGADAEYVRWLRAQ